MKLFIFGSTGDLVKRKVLPALQELSRAGVLNSAFGKSLKSGENTSLEIIALGRRLWNTKQYLEFACAGCNETFKEKISYQLIDFDKELILPDYKKHIQKNEISYFYLSLPPELQVKAINFLGLVKKERYKVKVLLEKPFGDSLNSAKKLHKSIILHGLEKDFLISDHYLFKDAVLSLNAKKFLNFKRLRVVSIESVGLEGRSYYDDVGALKDMVQSHFINIASQLLPLEELETAKVKHFSIAQYGNGKDEGYVKEFGKKSDTETFVHVIFNLKSEKEIEFITGKAFKEKISYIEIDGKRLDLEKGKNPYIQLFKSFLSGSTKHFPSIAQAIKAWIIIEKLEKEKQELKCYNQGIGFKETNL